MRVGRLVLVGLASALAGCASVPGDPFAAPPVADHLQRADAVGDCARRLRTLDRQIGAAGVRDAQDTVIAGFPYLRIDRSGVALRPPVDDEVRWQAWRARLADADRDARRHELRNAGSSASAWLDACRRTLLAADDAAAARAALAAAAQVPDDYSRTLRALGLYPLTRLAFAAGVAGWQRETTAIFSLPLDQLPLRGTLRPYAPPAEVGPALAAAMERAQGIAGSPRDALGLPRPAALAALLLRHAPRIEVEETGEYDRIGPLVLAGNDLQARVDLAAEPTAYVRVGHALFGGRWRPQLVYTFWFSQRPPRGVLDPLAGELDALIWRVTLDDEGNALVYDSIHACGCYHLFFATPQVQPRSERPPGQGRLDEGLFMPQAPLPRARVDERIVLRVESGSHYLQRAMLRADRAEALADAGAARRYALRDEDELRSLPVAGQVGVTRSAYDASGMIPGTERLERWLFWPMGIASAGQMRQWGRHATAFVGRRHFDDPLLLDRYFTLSTAEPQ
jgi:hypothetical protein